MTSMRRRWADVLHMVRVFERTMLCWWRRLAEEGVADDEAMGETSDSVRDLAAGEVVCQ